MLTHLFTYFQLIRFPNLLIVVFTQYLLAYWILVPSFIAANIPPVLNPLHFALLSLVTVLIAASGYVINDLEDRQIDLVNKKEKTIVGQKIRVKAALVYYNGLVLTGLVLSIYLAWFVDNLLLVLIYPSAVFLLWWYSKSLKGKAFWGNLVVGIFCAFVAGIVLFAERGAYLELVSQNPKLGNRVATVFGVYMGFAFFSTLFREIVKDMEDAKGDAAQGCKTLPIVWGMAKSKLVALAYALGLIILVGYFAWWSANRDGSFLVVGFLLLMILPIVWACVMLFKAKSTDQFHHLSQFAKFIMLGGLVLLFLA